MAAPGDDPILKRFREDLGRVYGGRLERIVLFGSRARGDARDDSDYDIAVFIRDFAEFSAELDRLVEVETEILFDTGAVINALPFPEGGYRQRSAFMHELRRDGLDL